MDAALLKNCHLFKNASPEDIAAIQQLAERKQYLAGDQIYLSGDQPETLWVIETGTVELIAQGKEIPVATLGGGQAFGDAAFFHHGKRPGSARAKETTCLISIPFAKLQKVLDERPQLAATFFRDAAGFYASLASRLAAELERPYF